MRLPRALAALAALGLATGASQMSPTRATFVLTNGERISGDVASDPETRTNIRADRREFTVDVGGSRQRLAVDRVVLIDFAGGQPPPGELKAVSVEAHLLSMRDGDLRPGRLVDLIGGDTIRWELAQGGQIDVPIRDVRRVFLQGERAREMYIDQRPTAAPGRSAARAARTRKVFTLKIQGALPWTDTGIEVRRGDLLGFESAGRVFFLDQKHASATAEGSPAYFDERLPVAAASPGALIARIGESGDPFVVSTEGTEVAMPGTGRLFLGINDSDFADNSGGFRVRITR